VTCSAVSCTSTNELHEHLRTLRADPHDRRAGLGTPHEQHLHCDVFHVVAQDADLLIGPAPTSCLGDNCQSSAQTGPVGSRQVRLAGDSGECGLVGCSRAWWNDQQNDHQGKQRGLGCVTAEPRPQLQADKAYDIAGRPRCAAEESFPRTGDNRLTDRSTVGDVNSRLWVSRRTGG
jgi:hypothetical protein